MLAVDKRKKKRNRHARVVIDGIDLLAAATSTEGDGGAFLTELSALEITNEDIFELSNVFVVLFDQLRQITDTATDVDGGSRIGHLQRLENGTNAFVGLELLWNTLNHESSCIERIDVLGGTEPSAAHANHGVPVDVYEEEDDKGDEIGNDHVSPEPDTTDISDGEEEEGVLGWALVHLGIVIKVDRN